jgi:N-acetylmuramoyl-L-alanine amidase
LKAGPGERKIRAGRELRQDGGSSIRLRTLLAALLVLPASADAASTDPIVLLQPGQRRELLPVQSGSAELVYLDEILQGLGVSVINDPAAGAVTLRLGGREASLFHRKSLVSIGGDLRLLSAPVVLDGGRWLLPVDGVPRVLGPLLAAPAEWRAASRVLVIGRVTIPKLSVTTFATGDQVRVVLEASEKVPFHVSQQEGRVSITVARDAVEVDFRQERLTGGIVDSVQFVGGRENVFSVALGKRFLQLKASEQDAPPRLVLDFQAAPLPARATPPGSPPPSPAAEPAAPADTARPLVVVIDPGHGGEEVGAKGPKGSLEKDVTLSIARKLKAALTNSLGHQVFLTRDKDEDVGLDQRAAIANNFKADLFVSIHANASRARGASGSEVYFLAYQASDDDSRRVAQAEGEIATTTASAGGGGDLALILWDMAQAEHLEESSSLASRIQEELADVTGSEGRGVKQAPFRVLVGAAMPAVLVEVAFISHPDEEKLLTSDTYQAKLAAGLMRGIRRYELERERRLGRLRSDRRPGS